MGKNRRIKIICGHTDFFVLLTAYVLKYSIESLVLMEAFTSNRSMVDINETAKGSAEIVPSLIAVHALLGCDNVPKMFDIGKKKNVTSIIEECSRFVAACYGFKNELNLTKARFSL